LRTSEAKKRFFLFLVQKCYVATMFFESRKFSAPSIRNVGVLIVPIGKLTAKEFGAKAVMPWNT